MGYVSPPVKALATATLLLGGVGCSALLEILPPGDRTTAPPTSRPVSSGPVEPVQTPEPPAAASSPAAAPQRDYWQEGVNRASSAVAIGQSAQSQDDWTLAASRWQQAVDLLHQVPATSPDYAQAQTKIQEYRTHLASAQQRAAGRPGPAAPVTPRRADGLVAQIPIQERHGGTPIVSVTLRGQKGSKTFPMMFDTGATGTLITPDMAAAIGVVIVDQTQAKIADGSIVTLPIGYVDAMEAGGLRKTSMLVAIGGSVGLLGQDFYGEYGIAMGSHVINLHE
jgi:predicted aspartyl protease